MNHGSLFSGIGGFDLASEWMGWENVFHCEWNEFGKKVLKHYWPKAISYDDIKKTDFTIHRGKIDILTGGFPCQPYSTAGKRKGKEDDRHLWPEMLRAIREIRPRWIVGENVSGLINWNGGLVFEEVQTDLEAEGYEVWANVLPAVSVNAPHRRDRVWFVAYSGGNGYKLRGSHQNRCPERAGESFKNKRQWIRNDVRGISKSRNDTNPNNERLQRRKLNEAFDQGGVQQKREIEGQSYKPTSKLYKDKNWENFPTQSPICSRDDGLSNRLDGITFPKWRQESVKAYGNAIVPQVAHQIFKALMLSF